jgi:hypothetical protein
MNALLPALGPIDVQPTMPQIDLRPTKLTKLLRS